ncbi:initiation-specific alpha-1,6-mannosyltransferase NDAI_0D03810 [Naumovozyma dairenensis CBS 421]|uniref:Glycosyltransferase family 32 protein n=1 Tax=Naumovozyma dairenensis (strain ATCC 10597 / BCRC 20456 / CBS 421 / NBRC 0211 / NRRL Y-12639) TaxID=1071378 RepID=G0WA84_NAUDC|nr:hypothetical protein NDAI_0D03810 [Naumovozyma dairenensis CBS 421]CCD24695.1 hypothetical protein NDAI_0D03810 [Naumovozyma dairenensis CBS 421]
MFPYDTQKPIPRKIWQTWKVSTNDPTFPSNFRNFQQKWSLAAKETENSTPSEEKFQYSLITDDNIESLLNNVYGEAPLVIDAFQLMPNNILKADFFRYLILYARGGIYSDMDTIPLKELKDWPSLSSSSSPSLFSSAPIPYKGFIPSSPSASVSPSASSRKEPGLVIGIEADPDREDWKKWYARRIQFCQWTIQSKPGHPILRELILNITSTTLNSVPHSNLKKIRNSMIDSTVKNDYNINYRDKRRDDKNYKHDSLKTFDNVDGSDIMNWTGPGIFSDIIFEYMNNLVKTNSDIILINSNYVVIPNLRPQLMRRIMKNQQKNNHTKIENSLNLKRLIPWEFFTLITEPVLVDDIMVLPITSFSPDVGQMEAKSSTDEMAFVKHMFEGSWKEEADSNKK